MSKDRFDFKLDDVFVDVKRNLKVINLRPVYDRYVADVIHENGKTEVINFTWGDLMYFVNANAFAKGKQYVCHEDFKVYTCTGEYRIQENINTGRNNLLVLVEGGGYLFFDELHTNLTPVFTEEDSFNLKSSVREMFTSHASACLKFAGAFYQVVDIGNIPDPVKRTIHYLDWSQRMKAALEETSRFFEKPLGSE